MSTDFCFPTPLKMDLMFSGALEKYGINEGIDAVWTTSFARCLTHGENWLWVNADDDGFVAMMTQNGLSDANFILTKIQEAFQVDIVSEHEPQYWGYATQEEWDAAQREPAHVTEERLYARLMRSVRGESKDSGSYARLARKLADSEPELLEPENKAVFIKRFNEKWLEDFVQARLPPKFRHFRFRDGAIVPAGPEGPDDHLNDPWPLGAEWQ